MSTWETWRGLCLPFVKGPSLRENEQVLRKEREFKERCAKLIDDLDSIYRKAYDLGKPFFDPTTYDKLKIRCETLDLKDDGEYANGIPAPNFFDPFPLETLKNHQITPEDSATKDYQNYENIFDKTKEDDTSQVVSYRLMRHFGLFRRNGIPGRRGRLIDITAWRQAEFPDFIQEYFMPGVYRQRGYSPSPAAWWEAQSTPLPHIMCIFEFYSFKGTEELLRGEILAILATTITRLELECYQDEVVIPVLMFSIMSDYKARIIQAFFNGDKLVIRKSMLYDFSTRATLSSSTTLFIQWMASKPVGDTRGFTLEDFVPFEEDDNIESSVKEEEEAAETENTAAAP
ncbi:hypothetical protein Aspvir_009506 [Aspergillus viridinutans]|uniref:Uncharacterized protein n=1 Tax=Aspergillus viridinutans TaxID=75553 RepID=A0A9P3F4L8_ASPVI|nr:uncharacterized protein Aspvir_009506 [Aspergillus viridinutans]GIK05397.1 hypothetical protein Aspvir_009506 [Aspergillus viridinutans]